MIAQQIASAVKSKRGRFLRKIETSTAEAKNLGVSSAAGDGTTDKTAWAVVEESAVLLKIKQALRDQGLVKDKNVQNSGEKDEALNGPTKKRAADVAKKRPTTDSAHRRRESNLEATPAIKGSKRQEPGLHHLTDMQVTFDRIKQANLVLYITWFL
jgi:hypothetical protein